MPTPPDRHLPPAPVAVIGMACRLPGDADTPEAYWKLLCDGRDVVGDVPVGRWRCPPGYEDAPIHRGGFLRDPFGFDAGFFAISPREALEMDPQQRLLLELSWEALEDAGVSPSSLRESQTGVFFGCMWQDYMRCASATLDGIEQHTATGQDSSVLAGRVSYYLGLRGPSLTVNTACSAGLASVHLACQSLLQGESELALAGGANLILTPHSSLAMARFGGLSPEGRCKPFDARADGYVRGEGGGVLVLKPLARALRDGDHIWALIVGSGVNNDGPSDSLTAPSPAGQAALLRAVYARAGIDPREVQYVEAHGTGTALGDPVEARALGEALGAGRDADCALRIGSAKGNVGHLEAASGVAGLLKAVLALKHRQLPPSLHFTTPNPAIPFDQLGLRVQTELTDWPRSDRALIAGVSSFGFGGTNAHVVLQSAEADDGAALLCIAADDAQTLEERTRRVAAAVSAAERPHQMQGAFRLASHRWSKGGLRRAVVASTPEQALAALHSGPQRPALRATAPALVFVFPPVDEPLAVDPALLLADGELRAALRSCERAIRALGGPPVVELLCAGPKAYVGAYTQLVGFSLQVALAQRWRANGLAPQCVVGLGSGELAAAVYADAASFEDAARALCLLAELSGRYAGLGAQAWLQAGTAELALALGGPAPRYPEVSVAREAGPRRTLVSGPDHQVRALVAEQAEAGRTARVVADLALYGPEAQGLAARLAAHGATVPMYARRPAVPCYSASTGQPIAEGQELTAHWANTLRSPIRERDTLAESQRGAGSVTFLEIMGAPLPRQAPERAGSDTTLPALGQRQLLAAQAALFEAGHKLEARSTPEERDYWRLPREVRRHLPLPAITDGGELSAGQPLLLPLSARSGQALRALCLGLREQLRELTDAQLTRLVHAAQTQRDHLPQRLALVFSSREELAQALEAHGRGDHWPGAVEGRAARGPGKLALLFPGQGFQWLGMGAALLDAEPVFADTIERCQRALSAHRAIDLAGALRERAPWPMSSDKLQPVLFAFQVALARLWQSWGLEVDAVVGHSVGEVAAAHLSGALNLEDAAALSCERAAALAPTIGQGAMALVEAPEELVHELVAAHPGELAVAVMHAPGYVVLSGTPRAVEGALGQLSEREVFCRPIDVDYASHSPQMTAPARRLAARLSGLQPRPGELALYSTVTEGRLDGAAMDATYWGRNLREPVRFRQTLAAMLDDGFDTFVEVSAHPVLGHGVLQNAAARGRSITCVASLRRGQADSAALLRALGELYVAGRAAPWPAAEPPPRETGIRLPRYPWQRQTYRKHADVALLSEQAPRPASGAPADDDLQPAAVTQLRPKETLSRSDPAALRRVITRELAAILRAAPGDIGAEADFRELGLDSLMALELRNRLQQLSGVSLSATALWACPTVEGLAEALSRGLPRADPQPPNPPTARAPDAAS